MRVHVRRVVCTDRIWRLLHLNLSDHPYWSYLKWLMVAHQFQNGGNSPQLSGCVELPLFPCILSSHSHPSHPSHRDWLRRTPTIWVGLSYADLSEGQQGHQQGGFPTKVQGCCPLAEKLDRDSRPKSFPHRRVEDEIRLLCVYLCIISHQTILPI